MGLIDKFKNLFTEEVEVEQPEQEKKEGVQKEVIQVEIPSPKKTRLEKYEEPVEEKKEEPIEQPKNEYKFPFFDDNDFDSIDVKPEPKEERKKSSFKKDVYNPPKEEKRVFRPSPIISPVYGILDKGYQKDEYSSKTDGRSSYYSSKEANVDAIRNKAYGGLEADIETTLFGGNRVLFNEKESTKEDILEKKEKIFSTLEGCFEFTEEVGFSRLLDGVAACLYADNSLEPFLPMSQISLPRMLTLSVNESSLIRGKAKKIIRILVGSEKPKETIPKLAETIGAEQFDGIARFFVDWAERNTITDRILKLIKEFAENLQDQSRTIFISKVTPILVPLVNNIDHPLQRHAIEIFSILLGGSFSQ